MNPLAGTAFSKLEALGNDFVLLDHRAGQPNPDADQVRALADRHTGIGCDQLLILRPAADPGADCRVDIFNSDGGPAGQCGNGMRAVALWLGDEKPDQNNCVLETAAGLIAVERISPGQFQASMGQPVFDAGACGVGQPEQVTQLVAEAIDCIDIGLVSMGNPHLVLLLGAPPGPEQVAAIGHQLSASPLFGDGININFATVDDDGRVQLQVHERGVGPTRACGSGACATAAFLIHGGRLQTPAIVDQPGGRLVINWQSHSASLFMTGPARRVFDGTLT